MGEREGTRQDRFSPFTAKPTKRTDIAATFPATQLGFLPAKVEGGFAHVIHFFFVLVFVAFAHFVNDGNLYKILCTRSARGQEN